MLRPAARSSSNFNHIWLVLELAATDLGNLIKRPALRMVWSQRHVQLILYQALQGLHYMHRANIVFTPLIKTLYFGISLTAIRYRDFLGGAGAPRPQAFKYTGH